MLQFHIKREKKGGKPAIYHVMENNGKNIIFLKNTGLCLKPNTMNSVPNI